jgi:hypothetical protein
MQKRLKTLLLKELEKMNTYGFVSKLLLFIPNMKPKSMLKEEIVNDIENMVQIVQGSKPIVNSIIPCMMAE